MPLRMDGMSKVALVLFLVLAGAVGSCAHSVQPRYYLFTCPKSNSKVRILVTQKDINNQDRLYDRVIRECPK